MVKDVKCKHLVSQVTVIITIKIKNMKKEAGIWKLIVLFLLISHCANAQLLS